jgi:hypothetical protein
MFFMLFSGIHLSDVRRHLNKKAAKSFHEQPKIIPLRLMESPNRFFAISRDGSSGLRQTPPLALLSAEPPGARPGARKKIIETIFI